MTSIAVIDYDVGNIRSIISAIEKVGAHPIFSRDASEVMSADGLVLPGVGAFPFGILKLKEYELDQIINKFAESNKPILGICLGMQLLFSKSEEYGVTNGLGLIPGVVRKLQLLDPFVKRLPHVGWNGLELPPTQSWDNNILSGIKINQDMYFVHSFEAVPDNKNHVLSTTKYSNNQFCSAVRRNNIFGCQFHPEKSAEGGLKVLHNFIQECRGNDIAR